MAAQGGILRKAYESVALFALLNLVGLVVLFGALVANGAITRDRAAAVVDILRGRTPRWDSPPPSDSPRPAAAPTVVLEGEGAARPPAAASDMELELVQRESERIKTELDQRLSLVNSIMLKVQQEREAFRKEREEAERREQVQLARQRDEGFRKQLEILETLPARLALDHLLGLGDPDEAANMLMAMDTGRAKKIVESAKRGADLERMKAILQKLPDTHFAGAIQASGGEEQAP